MSKLIPQFPAGGEDSLETVTQQDYAAWVGQGPVSPRHQEMLSKSDRGIVMLRTMIRQAMEAVQRGEDPVGVVRNAAVNEPFIDLHFESEGQAQPLTRLASSRSAAPASCPSPCVVFGAPPHERRDR